MRRAALVGLAALLLAAPAEAQWQLGGYFKYQLSLDHFGHDDFGALVITPDPHDQRLAARLNATYRRRRIDVTVSPELLLLAGDAIAARRREPSGGVGDRLLALPELDDTHQLFNLNLDRSLGDRADVLARLDRVSVGYTGDRFVARLGRQALTWGNGLVFQTLDLFDSFPPDALDVDYKPGRDMLTTQWLLPGGDDVQAIVVPGRERRGQPLTAGQSSVAAKWHHFADGAELDVLAARHDGDTVLGAGLSHSLAGGVWRLDVSHTWLARRQVTSLLANFDRAWAPGQRNLYAFGEYFYNGFGVADTGPESIELDPALVARLERGEVFNLGRHELAGGVRFEWTPLLTLSPTAIVNLRDRSTFALVQMQYGVRQNLVVFAGLQAGVGSRETEYGGVAVDGLPGLLAPGTRVWMRLSRYF